jgi:UDPglucose 6-dehydrogenase
MQKGDAMRYRVGIIGVGVVGSAVQSLLAARHDLVLYDEPKRIGRRADINSCDYVFICVPTPMLPNGRCDTRVVEDVVSWLRPGITAICHSTVEIGTTSRLNLSNPGLVFSPEYYGEGIAHPLQDLCTHKFVILGSDSKEALDRASHLYQTVYGSEVRIFKTDATTAEVVKYMENAFLACKVTFCNEMYELCQAAEVDYDAARELWLLDERVGRSHTFVYPDRRGFDGKCLPKDTAALGHWAQACGVDIPMLRAMIESNCRNLQKRGGDHSHSGQRCVCGLHDSDPQTNRLPDSESIPETLRA